MKILLLGGTTEASTLARELAAGAWDATLSLAGRTSAPAPQPIPTRKGGFGGPTGLADYLRSHCIDALIDATHPFAVQMKRHAIEAARATNTRLISIVRPPWQPGEGDRWQTVPDLQAAANAIGLTPRRIFLTVGQKELVPFLAAPHHHYLVRSIDRPPNLPPRAVFIAARGPFSEPDEYALLNEHRIDVIVTKNAGGNATHAKLRAARSLGIDVIMVDRPALPAGLDVVRTAEAALGWLVFHAGTVRIE